MSNTGQMQTPPQAAKKYKVSPETVIGWIKSNQLRAIDVSSRPGVGRPRYRIDPIDLAAFEAAREVGGAETPKRRKRKQAGVIEFF